VSCQKLRPDTASATLSKPRLDFVRHYIKLLLTLSLWSLPFLAVTLQISLAYLAIIALVLLTLQWILTLLKLSPPAKERVLRLETISASHFVEKVRWSLDRLGVTYRESANAGTLGAFFAGRTVPKLHVATGTVISTIGNSSDILRYLWGRYGSLPKFRQKAAFLEPTPEALELESQMDAYGADLQRWFYSNGLPARKLMMRVWGLHDRFVPFWQRWAVWVLYPLLCTMIRRAFDIRPKTPSWSADRIKNFLSQMETLLQDGRTYILNGEALSFVDITFASLSGIWIFPHQYGQGRAQYVLPEAELLPPQMQQDMQEWRESFPRVYAHIMARYENDRVVGPTAAANA